MIARWHDYLARQSAWRLSTLVLTLIAAVAIADYATGPLLSFSIFYVAPVALASWYAPRTIVILTCLVSTAVWLTVELAGIDYPNRLIPVWNAAVRLGFFTITSVLLVALNTLLQRQKELADIDSLTGILNRRAFEDRCRFLFRLAERQDRAVSIGFLDINKFKAANDRYGHQMGDRILAVVAETLSRTLRSSDIIGRVGGDEFALALADSDLNDARSQSTRIVAELRRAAAENDWPIGFSLGIVVCPPYSTSVAEALHLADELMYEVKKRAADGFLVREIDSDGGQDLRRSRDGDSASG